MLYIHILGTHKIIQIWTSTLPFTNANPFEMELKLKVYP